MLIAAAVCPHPPILVPEATGGGWRDSPVSDGTAFDSTVFDGTAFDGTGFDGAKELAQLRAACDEAVASLLSVRPDLLAIVGAAPASTAGPARPAGPVWSAEAGGPSGEEAGPPAAGDGRTPAGGSPSEGGDGWLAEYPPASPGCLGQFGVWGQAPDAATRAAIARGSGRAPDGGPELPLSLTIGRWLLDRAAPAPGAARLFAVADTAPPAECLAAGARLAGLAPRVALLVMGDGTARRAQGVPGAPDPEAERYDQAVAAALARADSRALAGLDPAESAALLVAGRAPWQVLAGAAGGGFRGRVAYAATPFEVAYVVATWRREP